MSDTHAPTGSWREAGQHAIRLTGHLDQRWAAWFDGLALSHVRDRGLPLVSLAPGRNRPVRHPTHHR